MWPRCPSDQGGDVISKVGYAPANWYKATVPGTVLTSLVNDGVYPEPLYGENNRPDNIPESLCRTSYWYRTEVGVPADFAGKRIWLNFDGINYTADVWVNGKQAGTIKGAFARGIFDVTDLVKPGQRAAIAVRINPPPHPGNSAGAHGGGGDRRQRRSAHAGRPHFRMHGRLGLDSRHSRPRHGDLAESDPLHHGPGAR